MPTLQMSVMTIQSKEDYEKINDFLENVSPSQLRLHQKKLSQLLLPVIKRLKMPYCYHHD